VDNVTDGVAPLERAGLQQRPAHAGTRGPAAHDGADRDPGHEIQVGLPVLARNAFHGNAST